jgi:hypothetical protein
MKKELRGFFQSKGFIQKNADGSIGQGAQAGETPDWLWKAMESVYGKFDLDPCPHNPKFDGLKIPWKRLNYCNPPYIKIRPWLEKAIDEANKGKGTVFLIPFRPTTSYFQQLILPHATELRILGDNVAFKGFKNKMPIRLAVILFGKAKKPLSQGRDAQATIPLYVLPMSKDPEERTLPALARQLEKRRGKPYQKRWIERAPHKDGFAVLGNAQGQLKEWSEAAGRRKSVTDFMLMPNMESKPFLNEILLNKDLAAAAFPRPHLVVDSKYKTHSPFASVVAFAPSKPSTKGMLAFPKRTFVWTPDEQHFKV